MTREEVRKLHNAARRKGRSEGAREARVACLSLMLDHDLPQEQIADILGLEGKNDPQQAPISIIQEIISNVTTLAHCEGRQQGRAATTKQVIHGMKKHGMSAKRIGDLLHLSPATVRRITGCVGK